MIYSVLHPSIPAPMSTHVLLALFTLTHPHTSLVPPHSPHSPPPPNSPSPLLKPLTLASTHPHPHPHSPSPPLTLTPPTQGYLFVSVIFGENHDLMPLVIQAIRLDLQSPNSVFKSLAMQCIANIGSKLMAAQVGPEIPPLLTAG